MTHDNIRNPGSSPDSTPAVDHAPSSDAPTERVDRPLLDLTKASGSDSPPDASPERPVVDLFADVSQPPTAVSERDMPGLGDHVGVVIDSYGAPEVPAGGLPTIRAIEPGSLSLVMDISVDAPKPSADGPVEEIEPQPQPVDRPVETPADAMGDDLDVAEQPIEAPDTPIEAEAPADAVPSTEIGIPDNSVGTPDTLPPSTDLVSTVVDAEIRDDVPEIPEVVEPDGIYAEAADGTWQNIDTPNASGEAAGDTPPAGSDWPGWRAADSGISPERLQEMDKALINALFASDPDVPTHEPQPDLQRSAPETPPGMPKRADKPVFAEPETPSTPDITPDKPSFETPPDAVMPDSGVEAPDTLTAEEVSAPDAPATPEPEPEIAQPDRNEMDAQALTTFATMRHQTGRALKKTGKVAARSAWSGTKGIGKTLKVIGLLLPSIPVATKLLAVNDFKFEKQPLYTLREPSRFRKNGLYEVGFKIANFQTTVKVRAKSAAEAQAKLSGKGHHLLKVYAAAKATRRM